MAPLRREYDVIVAGGGNAGLCAAIKSAEEGLRVLLVERGGPVDRGGNTKYTRDIRYAHDRADGYTTGPYTEEEFLRDLLSVTGGETDLDLARLVIERSHDIPGFMVKHGVRLQRAYRGALHLSRTNAFFLGGGRGLLNAYYRSAEELGVDILYNSSVEDLRISGDTFEEALISTPGGVVSIRGRAFIAASGGFEANIEWLKRYWGDAAENFIIRGSRYNDGKLLRILIERGAQETGDPRGMHAVAVDARSPRYDGGIVTRVDSIPFGIVVNIYGKRFYDEGEDLWPKRYAIWGRLIAEQPGQIAYSIFDSKVLGLFIPPAYPPIEAGSIGELGRKIGVDPLALERTISEYNSSVVCKRFDPGELDECSTRGLIPPKSHWALKIDSPPFYAYPLRPGITFTYLGVRVDRRGRVAMRGGGFYRNVFAAGEIMMGNILSRGYLGGLGLTIGSVFGWISGEGAAEV
ncbi:MAG: FAD-dependent tricarballylate dehydrogenase TcuA [Sulfolobales archaeon]